MKAVRILSLTAIIMVGGSAIGAYSGGSGTISDPYKIADVNGLLTLAANKSDYSKCFILIDDVNMSGTVFTTAIIAPDISSSPGFQGTVFSGVFDGNEHKIIGFAITGGSNSYLGLFGNTSSGSTIKNLGLENCTVSGSDHVGGLLGTNYGTVINCYSTGAVSGSSIVGGLIGYNFGSVNSCYATGNVNAGNSSDIGGLVGKNYGKTISNCHATGMVTTAYSNYVGGLVGRNYGDTITNCYSTGAISGSWQSDWLGGLVGYHYESVNNSTISQCYSTSSVTGGENVGGLVGENFSTITDCYATGNVIGMMASPASGGLVGRNDSSYVTNCYSTGLVNHANNEWVGGLIGYNGTAVNSFWDTQTSSMTTSVGGTGLTTAQMMQQISFTGWDFTNIWAICEGTNYPRLKWQIPKADWVCPNGVGIEDLAYFVQSWMESDCSSSNNNCGGTDINTTGSVDLADFALFAENWLSGQ
jgi:hypothetical protein